MRFRPSFSAALAAAAVFVAPTLGATKPGIISGSATLPALQFDGSATFREFRVNDSAALPFNISTFTTPTDFTTTSGLGMYGWNLLYTGKAYNPTRPLLIVMGSSVTRSEDVSDPVSVLNAGLIETWSYRIRTNSSYAQAILNDAGIGVLNIVSPRCYNTTTKSPLRNACQNAETLHSLRHYRPKVILDLLKQVQTTFGYDPEKVVGSGASMGARGIMRLGTAYPLKAISIVGGGLESSTSTYLQSRRCSIVTCGEPCWDLYVSDNKKQVCKHPVDDDLVLANRLSRTQVQIYASYGDAVANLTTVVRPTCSAINKAAAKLASNSSSASGPEKVSAPPCQIRMKYTPRAKGARGPSHQQLCNYSYDSQDLNFLISGYGGGAVKFDAHEGLTSKLPDP